MKAQTPYKRYVWTWSHPLVSAEKLWSFKLSGFFLCFFYCLGVLKPDMTDGWCKYVKCNFTACFKEEKSQYNLKKRWKGVIYRSIEWQKADLLVISSVHWSSGSEWYNQDVKAH